MTHSLGTKISNEDKANFLIGFLLVLCACILIAGKILLNDMAKSTEIPQKSGIQVASTTGEINLESQSSSIQVKSYIVDDDEAP